MIIFICGIVLALAAFICLGIYQKESYTYAWKVRKLQLISIVPLALGIMISTIKFVPTGYTGILTTFGKVESQTLKAGLNFTAPWQKVIKMDNRTQKQVVETEAFSSDIQQVNVIVTLNYSIDKATAQNLYSNVGTEYVTTILTPRALEDIKTVFSGYTAEELISSRIELSESIYDVVSDDVSEYGIKVSGVSIEDIDFTDAFTDAVEAKQVATQNKLTAETKQAQLTLEAQAEADRKIISAKAEAEANKVISSSITPELISMKEAEARLKHGWITVQGADSVVAKE